jgi:hypothetical protein
MYAPVSVAERVDMIFSRRLKVRTLAPNDRRPAAAQGAYRNFRLATSRYGRANNSNFDSSDLKHLRDRRKLPRLVAGFRRCKVTRYCLGREAGVTFGCDFETLARRLT